jgi:predicted PurR-regulated permease PerM
MKSTLTLLAVILVIGFAHFASAFLIPVFLSLFLAMLIDPAVGFFERHGVRRKVSTYVVVGTLTAIGGVVGWLIYSSSASLLSSIATSPRLASLVAELQKSAVHFDPSSSTLFESFSMKFTDGIQKVQVIEKYPIWMKMMLSAFGSLFELMSLAIFVPILIFYFLHEKENLIESLNGLLGPYLYLPTLNSELPLMIRAFFSANIVTALLLVITHAVALYAIGFTNWLPLALATGLLNVVPISVFAIIGSGVLPPDVAFPYMAAALATLLLHFIFNSLILPLLMGGKTNINTSSLIVGLLFWSWLWGAVGFLIAIPMTVLLKIFLESNRATVPIANLMAAEPMALLPGIEDEAEAPIY